MSLVVDDLGVRYGGRVALAGLHLEAPFGAVTGLLGSNGSGKSSAIGAIAGQVAAACGRVHLDGQDISALRPWQRAARGLGRSFQRASVFPGLTVRDDVGLGWEAGRVGARAVRLFSRRKERAERDQAVGQALALLGVDHLADRMTETLSFGERRLVELARCIAGDRRMLLLDEPSCNLDGAERAVLAEALLAVAGRGIGVVLVDHDLELITRTCTRVIVLDHGQTIFSGRVTEFADNADVQAAFLGKMS